MSDFVARIVTPNLARVLVAIALIMAVFLAGSIARVAFLSGEPGLHSAEGKFTSLGLIGGDRRLVRTTKVGESEIICSEGPRQLMSASAPSNDQHNKNPSPAVLSTVFLREAAWQVCNAYANGIIDKAKYTKLLTSLVSKGVVESSARSPAKHHRGHAQHGHRGGRARSA